jgi:cobyrinic acid a,c-diamide synthase
LKIPRLVVAGVTSGVGKTLITCAIIHGLKKRGYSVQPFKVGPDFIDPFFLSRISKNVARNLDPWLMGKNNLLTNFVRNSNSDISIIEGVMGYYDGFSGKSNFSSTFDVASTLECPTILILDASKTSRSIAAIATGFKKFHRNSRISGIILNKIGSKKHELLCRDALESLKIPIVAVIPRDESFQLESRHLGLIPTIEQKKQAILIQKISKKISDYISFEKIVTMCKNSKSIKKSIFEIKKKQKQVTIGIALDSSFNFYYQENIDSLRYQGAEIKFFSPISDKKIPECHGLYIGGGFPEILGSQLSKNHNMKKSIKKFAEDGMPIYAECGGLMYLSKSITHNKKKYPMIGLFDADTIMTTKMKLNYTKGDVINNNIISTPRANFHAHEFHYSELESIPSDYKFAYKLSIGQGIKKRYDGLLLYDTLASYCHLFFNDSIYAKKLVNNCLKFSRR